MILTTNKDIFYQYMMNKECALQNEVIQLNNNVAYRDADYLDHLEMVLAKKRLETTQEIFKDLRFLLRTYPLDVRRETC